MREFMRRRSSPEASLSLIDCRAITPAAYSTLAPSTRPRAGFGGWPATVFNYEDVEMPESEKTVLKAFWSWKRVGVPKGWREVRANAQERPAFGSTGMEYGKGRWAGARNRRNSWWREDEADYRAGCVIM